MKIRPLHDRVIVKRVDAETRTASGIYIPEAAGENLIRVLSSLSVQASVTKQASSSLWMLR